MTRLKDLIKAYGNLISRNHSMKGNLEAKIKDINAFKTKCSTSKTVGTVSNVIGGVSVALIPFTGGVSAWVGLAFVTCGVATKGITNYINSKETKKFLRELDSFNDSRINDIKQLTILMQELSEYVQEFKENGLDDATALTHAIARMAGVPHITSSSHFTLDINGIEDKLLTIGKASVAIYYGNLIITKSLAAAIGMKGVIVFENLIKDFAVVMADLVEKLGEGGLVTIAAAAFIVIDVAKLVQEWKSEHAAAKYGSEILSQIDKEIKCYDEMLRKLLEFQKYLDELEEEKEDEKEHTLEHWLTILSKIYEIIQRCIKMLKRLARFFRDFVDELEEEEEEEEEEECTCTDVELSVFYVNIQSMRPSCSNSPKHAAFCDHIRGKRPDIVVIVETWLTPDIRTEFIEHIWNLQDYDLYRYDRRDEGRQGGGILVGWRRGHLARMHFDFDPDSDLSSSYFYNLDKDFLRFFCFSRGFNCSRCKKIQLKENGFDSKTYSLAVYYRRPGPYKESKTKDLPAEDPEKFRDQDVECAHYMLDSFLKGIYLFKRSAGVIVGDFNWSNKAWNDYIGHGSGYFRVPIEGPTYRGKTNPDAIICMPQEFVHPLPIKAYDCGTSHKALYFKLKLGKDYVDERPCVFCKCNIG